MSLVLSMCVLLSSPFSAFSFSLCLSGGPYLAFNRHSTLLIASKLGVRAVARSVMGFGCAWICKWMKQKLALLRMEGWTILDNSTEFDKNKYGGAQVD